LISRNQVYSPGCATTAPIILPNSPASSKHVVVLGGGLSEKQRRETAKQLAQIPDSEERVIVATGRYLQEGFDDARLGTLFLTMPIPGLDARQSLSIFERTRTDSL